MPNEDLHQDAIGYPEAQRISGFSRSTLQRLVRNGQLRVTKVGRATRVDKHSLERYMRDHDYAEQLQLFD